MTASMRIDQAGLGAGVAGLSRTDGLATGAKVTLTSLGTGSKHRFQLLWVPPEDTNAVASLVATANPKVWEFIPLTGSRGEYLIELIEDEGLPTETSQRRVLGVRLAVSQLLIPAFNSRADQQASLVNAGAAAVAASDNNAVDFPSSPLNGVAWAGWWRAHRELFLKVEALAAVPPGGLTPPASPGDNGKIAVASSGDLVYTDTITVAKITSANVEFTGTGFLNWPGSGPAPATTGDARAYHGWSMSGRNNANNANHGMLAWGAVTDRLTVGSTGIGVLVDCSTVNGFQVRPNGVAQFQVTGTNIKFFEDQVFWDDGVVNPELFQETDTTNSVTGDTFLIRPQDCTGTGSTGGSLSLRAGLGVSTNGTFRVLSNATPTTAIEVKDVGGAPGIGFLGATAAIRQNIVGSRGGNVALLNLLGALQTLGLITNSTSA